MLFRSVSKLYLNKTDELTMPEAIALEWYVGTDLMVIENNHVQFHAGFLSQEHWQRNLDELRCYFTVPLFREIARNWVFRESFKRTILDVMREIPDDEPNCWAVGWDYPMQ